MRNSFNPSESSIAPGDLCKADLLARSGLLQRFLDKVDRKDDQNACWPWLAQKDRKGYGHFRIGSKYENTRRKAASHRVALALTGVDVPVDKMVLHHCDNPPCCNPRHLYLGTVKNNAADMKKRKRAVGKHDQWLKRNPNYKHVFYAKPRY